MRQMFKSLATRLIYVALIAYPFAEHFKLLESGFIPLILMFIIFSMAVMIRQRMAALMLALMLIASLILIQQGFSQDVYFLPPIAVNYFIGMIFLKSLMKNSTPVIEKYMLLLEGEIDAAERKYARWFTTLWAVVLLSLAIETAVLALFYSHETWSLFANFINYFILGLMFLVEYLIRLRMFPQKQHKSFIQFINSLRKIKLKAVVM